MTNPRLEQVLDGAWGEDAAEGDVWTLDSELKPAWKPGGGGGGSQPGAARVLGPFPVAFDDAGLAAGIAFYTPTIGDVLVDAWVEIRTAWDGTTPLLDIGPFTGSGSNKHGLFWVANTALDATQADGSITQAPNYLSIQGGGATVSDLVQAQLAATEGYRLTPASFLGAAPLKVVVSQDGKAGGADPGATQGEAALYLMVATPSLT